MMDRAAYIVSLVIVGLAIALILFAWVVLA